MQAYFIQHPPWSYLLTAYVLTSSSSRSPKSLGGYIEIVLRL